MHRSRTRAPKDPFTHILTLSGLKVKDAEQIQKEDLIAVLVDGLDMNLESEEAQNGLYELLNKFYQVEWKKNGVLAVRMNFDAIPDEKKKAVKAQIEFVRATYKGKFEEIQKGGQVI